ncbi:hypothetical protein M378DRAFT_806761 [Amanita muscaria Koide BX008]|uniref:Uncharacterized protein n=1 Tax=Amanita muscaria (strain Koide BX008) TaxID=946122 RepID=A0A0C2T627_AMAMK|nr:hypothetical protein M378DRAFT_806761 [Amanita muscaria Koide BX008]
MSRNKRRLRVRITVHPSREPIQWATRLCYSDESNNVMLRSAKRLLDAVMHSIFLVAFLLSLFRLTNGSLISWGFSSGLSFTIYLLLMAHCLRWIFFEDERINGIMLTLIVLVFLLTY